MATIKVNQVLRGIKNLSAVELRELAELLSETTVERNRNLVISNEAFLEKAYTVHTAPIGSGGCACCGRS